LIGRTLVWQGVGRRSRVWWWSVHSGAHICWVRCSIRCPF